MIGSSDRNRTCIDRLSVGRTAIVLQNHEYLSKTYELANSAWIGQDSRNRTCARTIPGCETTTILYPENFGLLLISGIYCLALQADPLARSLLLLTAHGEPSRPPIFTPGVLTTGFILGTAHLGLFRVAIPQSRSAFATLAWSQAPRRSIIAYF